MRPVEAGPGSSADDRRTPSGRGNSHCRSAAPSRISSAASRQPLLHPLVTRDVLSAPRADPAGCSHLPDGLALKTVADVVRNIYVGRIPVHVKPAVATEYAHLVTTIVDVDLEVGS